MISYFIFAIVVALSTLGAAAQTVNFDGHYVVPSENECTHALEFVGEDGAGFSGNVDWQLATVRGGSKARGLMCTSVTRCVELAQAFGFDLSQTNAYRPALNYAFSVYERRFIHPTVGTIVFQTLVAQPGSYQFGACRQETIPGNASPEF